MKICCKLLTFVLLSAMIGGCALPVRVEGRAAAERKNYGQTDHAPGSLSSSTVNLLGDFLLTELYEKAPEQALVQLEQLFKKSRMPEVIAALADAALQAGYRFSSKRELASRYFAAAAFYSSCYLRELDDLKDPYCEQRVRQIRICNQALTELFCCLKAGGLERRAGFELPMPGDRGITVRFKAPVYELPVDADAIRSFTPCANYRIVGLTHDTRISGLGVPMIAELKSGMYDVGGRIMAEVPLPVTLAADFEADPQGNGITVQLRYIYPRCRERIRMGGRDFPLAADFSTPLAFVAGQKQRMNFIERTVKVSEAAEFTGLYHLEPFDENRIPVIFVHGLMSDVKTWSQMLNTLLHDPVLRRKFQFLGFAYSSGNPIFVSGAVLRRELKSFREKLVNAKRSTANFDKMVLVGHSMGGLLSRLQVTESSGALLLKELGIRDGGSVKKKLPAAEQKILEELLNFTPSPSVKRVIFIAVPHKGSAAAATLVGRAGASLIRLPAELVRRNLRLISALFKGKEGILAKVRTGTGVDNLRPDDTMLNYLNKLKMSPHIPFHSIIGNRKAWGIPGGSDGIVPYFSSHLDNAASELVVKSGHSVQQNALAIQEVRRILHLHLQREGEGVK